MAVIIAACAALAATVLTGYYLGWGGLFLLAIVLMLVVSEAREKFDVARLARAPHRRQASDAHDRDHRDW